MSIADHVIVNLTVGGAAPPAAGFGVPMILFETEVGDPARILGPYTSVADWVAAGGLANDAVGLWATALLSQRPRPSRFVVGRIDSTDLTLADSLAAIYAEGPGDWYCTDMVSRNADEILALAIFSEPLLKIAIVQSSSAALLAGTAESAQTMTLTVGGTATAGTYTATIRNPRTGATIATATFVRVGETNDQIAAELAADLETALDPAIAAVSVASNVVTIAFVAGQAGIDFEA